jgi:transposase
MPTHGGNCMKKTRQHYDRDFKISILTELEAGKPLAQVAREHGIHPSLPCRWKTELAENPERAFSGNENKYKDQARIAELERLLGQAHAENELLKKAFAMTQKKIREERLKPMLRDGI